MIVGDAAAELAENPCAQLGVVSSSQAKRDATAVRSSGALAAIRVSATLVMPAALRYSIVRDARPHLTRFGQQLLRQIRRRQRPPRQLLQLGPEPPEATFGGAAEQRQLEHLRRALTSANLPLHGLRVALREQAEDRLRLAKEHAQDRVLE